MTKTQVHSLSKPKTTIIAAFLSGLMLVTSLIGCSSSPDPIPPEDANGLFTGTGTVNSGTSLTDIRGFVHEGRFIFFDKTEAVLYDGQISSISGSDLTATVDVYKDGAKVTPTSVAVTGMVTGRSSMLLSLNGTGYAAGSLTLTFDLLYDRGATIAKLFADSFARWVGDSHTPATLIGGNVSILSENDVTVTEFRGDTGAPAFCFYDGFKSIPDPVINIYLITALDVTDTGGTSCDHIGAGYTGFFAVVDGTGTDDTLLFAATNGTNSNFSVMTK